jgi:hypothetical protein
MASSHNAKRVATPPVMSKPRGDKVVASIGNLQKDLGSSRYGYHTKVAPTSDSNKEISDTYKQNKERKGQMWTDADDTIILNLQKQLGDQ